MKHLLIIAPFFLALLGCGGESDETGSKADAPTRGLKTILLEQTEETTVRRYPSVLQPGSITTLSFEISGRLSEVTLDVGQTVKEGDVLAEIDTRSLKLQVQSSEAAVAEAQSRARTAAADYERKKTLFDKKVIAAAVADQSRMEAEATAAQVVQAQRSLETAQENLTKAQLKAPFDGIINSVEVQSFANVSGGMSVATLYAADVFETSFSVSFEVVNKLAVGKKVRVRLADNPDVVLKGHVSELGSRADTVSSFPVVVKLDETDPSIKAGMAVEISLEFSVPKGQGFTLPLSVLPFDGTLEQTKKPSEPRHTEVFVYNPKDSTVNRRKVTVAGVRENAIIIIDGLTLGERVASAGVSFLRDGQKVHLLSENTN